MPTRDELRHVRDIRGVRIARPGGLAVSLTLVEAAALPAGGPDDDDTRQHVAALAAALIALQSQRARVALEVLTHC